MADIKKALESSIVKGWTTELMNYIATGNRSDPSEGNETLQKLYDARDKLEMEIAMAQHELEKACQKFDTLTKGIAHKAMQVKLNPLKPYRRLEIDE